MPSHLPPRLERYSKDSRAPCEQPREYNDPSKQDYPGTFYDRSVWPGRIQSAVMLAILAGVGFIVFNVVFG